jgi:hypothetical protein
MRFSILLQLFCVPVCNAPPRAVVGRTANVDAGNLNCADGAFGALWQALWLIHLLKDDLVILRPSAFYPCLAVCDDVQ